MTWSKPSTSDFKPASDCEQIDMFSIPILRGNLQDIDIEEVKRDCRNLVKEASQRHGDNNSMNYTTYFDEELRQEMIKLPWYADFAEQVKDTYIQFIQICYGQQVGHINRADLHLFAWINVYGAPHHHVPHNHINSYMSGTWYLKVEENTPQPIQFLNPNPAMAHALNLPIEEFGSEAIPNMKNIGSAYYHDQVEFYPVENQFLLWPSALMHGVPMNHDDVDPNYERISISFNLHHPIGVPNQNEAGEDLEYEFLEQPPVEEPIEELPSAVDDAAEVMSRPKGVLF